MEEIWAIKDIKVYYAKAIADLSLKEFNVFILKIQKWCNKYGGYTSEQYYLFLIKNLLCDKFMKTFFKIIQEK